MRAKALGLGIVCAAVVAGGAGYAAFGHEDVSAGAGPRVEASISGWRWAPRDEPLAPPAVAKPRVKRVERKAATTARRDTTPTAGADDGTQLPDDGSHDKAPTGPATAGLPATRDSKLNVPDTGSDHGDDVLEKAEVLKNGVALPPLEAPAQVRAMFEAGNTIARAPYIWGGGHGKWQDKGYDCSGSVSYALAAGGFLNAPLASGPLMHWGKPGKGKWITIYANAGHVWMVVAGVRFDTVARGQTGSRWINSIADTSGYVARHPEGF